MPFVAMAQKESQMFSFYDESSKFSRSVSMALRSNILVESLDQIEFRVNSLREQAGTLEQEKVTLLEMIKQIKETIATQNISEGEREELTLLTDQLMIRTDAVHIGLGTVRSEQQEESLRQVTALLEDLSQELIEGGRTGKAQLESYLNACLSHGDERHADEKFQALVISCALEDQKIIRKRLESMVRHS
ncbi:BAG family molecular chaperone regulator 2-like isoform X1 [Protopterus annectens]|uniref:BAG family molecular chaperone regulator 2-like isoform X1 n=1 Tax=Protopterus annectens TaxID=7888 RepID=UPI001CFA2454|nr:BAG family molecular chaperone regulator 2-like isoform X1 [Protopterus annectens]